MCNNIKYLIDIDTSKLRNISLDDAIMYLKSLQEKYCDSYKNLYICDDSFKDEDGYLVEDIQLKGDEI